MEPICFLIILQFIFHRTNTGVQINVTSGQRNHEGEEKGILKPENGTNSRYKKQRKNKKWAKKKKNKKKRGRSPQEQST